MKANQIGQPPYRITGACADGSTETSRVQVGSALVLAQRWIEASYTHVRIADAAGVIWDPGAFQQQRFAALRRPGGQPGDKTATKA